VRGKKPLYASTLALLMFVCAACGLGRPAYAKDPDPEEQGTDAAADESDDADAVSEDAVVERDESDDTAADEDDPEGADATADESRAADEDEDEVESQVADGADDAGTAGDQTADDSVGDAPPDNLADVWAPAMVVDESDDAIAIDKTLDPTGVAWEAVEPGVVDDRGNRGETAKERSGDYAGPSELLTVRPPSRRAPSAGAGRPPTAGGGGKDTPYSTGGKPALAKSAPWMAQLYYPRDNSAFAEKLRLGMPLWQVQHKCGGTLIDFDKDTGTGWVLTAAHCFDQDLVEAGYRVRFGSEDISKGDGTTYRIDRAYTHLKYANRRHPDPPLSPVKPPNMYEYDIALIHITRDDQTKPLGDPTRMRKLDIYTKPVLERGTEVTVTGWGKTENVDLNKNSAVLMKVDLQVMDTADCMRRRNYGPERINSRVICAAAPTQKTCKGDSGGPLTTTNDTAYLVGLVSWAKGTCTDDDEPVVFTRVQSYLSWIDEVKKVNKTRTVDKTYAYP